jgi:hypothetical protein
MLSARTVSLVMFKQSSDSRPASIVKLELIAPRPVQISVRLVYQEHLRMPLARQSASYVHLAIQTAKSSRHIAVSLAKRDFSPPDWVKRRVTDASKASTDQQILQQACA